MSFNRFWLMGRLPYSTDQGNTKFSELFKSSLRSDLATTSETQVPKVKVAKNRRVMSQHCIAWMFTLTSCLLLGLGQHHTAIGEPPPANSIIASFGSEQLTLAQIDAVIDNNPAFAQMKRENPANVDVLRKNVADRLINRALLLTHALNSRAINSEDVKANVAKVVKGYGGKVALEAQLKRMGSTYARFIDDIETDFQINSFIENKIVPGIVVSEEELRNTFAKAPQNYASPETVRARHILLTLGQQATEEETSKAHEKLLKIRRKIVSGEASFEDLAKKYSEGPTAPNGGDLGSFPRGRMVPEFERVAFALPTGSISEPVRTQYGLHLIKVEAHHKPKPPTFEQARPIVQKILTKKKADAQVTALVEELRRKAKVEIKL